MKAGKGQQQEDCRGSGDKSNGVDENVETALLARLKLLGADFLVLSAGVLLLCGLVFLVVLLFRMGNVGQDVVSSVSSCSAVLAAAAWPILIVALVVLYRRHIVEALKELPCFIKAYAAAELKDKLSVASSNGDDGQGSGVEGAGGTRATWRRGGETGASVENVLDVMQDECGEFVFRRANLFSVRDFRFDGAIVGENRITGIEVSRGDVEDDRSCLDRIGEFYRAVPKRDRHRFGLVYCIPAGEGVRMAALREHCRRRGFDFPVAFRQFENGNSK